MNDCYKKTVERIENASCCRPVSCCCHIVGPTGSTGPSGEIVPGTFLFNVRGENGIATMGIGNEIIFQSNTLDINVSQGSAIVDLEYNGSGTTGATGPQGDIGPTGPQGNLGPTGAQGIQGSQGITGSQGLQGPMGGMLLEYTDEYLYLAYQDSYNSGVFGTTYIMPFSGVAKEISINLIVGYRVVIAPNTIGTVSYNLIARPFGTTNDVVIATGVLMPIVDENTESGDILSVSNVVNAPFNVNDELIVELIYDVEPPTLSNFWADGNARIYVERI